MPFSETIQTIPFTPRTANASGFFPPMARAMGHVLYLAACAADESVTINAGEGESELDHAVEHWNARAITENVSAEAAARSAVLGTALTEARAEWPEWDRETRATNMRNLANRLLQYTADLDRELVGIRGSDPGSAL